MEARHSIRKKHRSWGKYRCKQDSESYKEYTKARNKAKSIITRERKNREKQIAVILYIFELSFIIIVFYCKYTAEKISQYLSLFPIV
jgi:hypothetical protein